MPQSREIVPSRDCRWPLPGTGPAASAALWAVLVCLAVVGRIWQPGWNVTPLAAVALAAGAAFPNPAAAASVPLAALAISNLALPAYGSLAMAAVVFAATAWPVLLGGVVRRGRWTAVVGGALASSLVFFLATNAAHWLLTDDYPHSPAGLAACFVAALPFYRWMPVGDVVWSLALFGTLQCLGTAVTPRLERTPCPVPARGRGVQPLD